MHGKHPPHRSAPELRWLPWAGHTANPATNGDEFMAEASENVLAFRPIPKTHWRKTWNTKLLEEVTEATKCRAGVVGIPNDAEIIRVDEALVLEQDEQWQLEGRRMLSAESMTAIPELEALPALQSASTSAGQHPGTR
jgi:putative transposase